MKELLTEFVKDLKSIRNSVYLIDHASNPYERDVRRGESCTISHDLTEKWKDRLKESE